MSWWSSYPQGTAVQVRKSGKWVAGTSNGFDPGLGAVVVDIGTQFFRLVTGPTQIRLRPQGGAGGA